MSCLEEIRASILHCPVCQSGLQGVIVVGEGSQQAKIAFIGEAPGKTELKLQRPFVGRSGQLLRQLIAMLQLPDEQIFITSAVKYLPEYVTPREADIVHGRIHLMAQLQCIQPTLIILLGKSAVWSVLGKKVAVASVHGTIEEVNGWPCFITVHPAAAVRNKRYDTMLRTDFFQIRKLLIERFLIDV